MNLLSALCAVRSYARASASIHTRHGRAALRVVEKKIQQLLRKKAWRENVAGSIPPHMGDETHVYPIPEDPVAAALRELAAAEAEFVASLQEMRSPRLRAAVEQANAVLDTLETLKID